VLDGVYANERRKLRFHVLAASLVGTVPRLHNVIVFRVETRSA
jgi:hypothetical protein